MPVVKLDLDRRLGVIDRKVYGMFIEHLGRCIYGGIYEPGSPLSDAKGFRQDVLEAARGLRAPILRWPGGNFVSGYHWLDGVGPRDRRPARPELAWNTMESNEFGTNEFIEYARALDTEPYVCANLGSGTMDEAAAWVEYCNRNDGTSYAKLRAEHGFEAPHCVTYWGLGNEMYGDWQIGHKSAPEYAVFARQCAKRMKAIDPSIKLILCGGQVLGHDPAAFVDWNVTTLTRCADLVDYIAYHFYWGPVEGQDAHYSTLAQPYQSERHLQFLWHLIEQIRRDGRVEHPIRIALDEWNVWYRVHDNQLEERYDLTDALSVAIYLNMMRRNCQAIGMANLAQMVNVIAPIFTSPEGMFLQTIYHPLRLAAEKSGPIALDAHVGCDGFAASYLGLDTVPFLDVLATLDEESKKIYLSLVNLSKEEDQHVDVRLLGAELAGEGLSHVVSGEAPDVANDFGEERVAVNTGAVTSAGSRLRYTLPKLSHAVLELSIT
jgi:alpha-N-arabinofuranosidase